MKSVLTGFKRLNQSPLCVGSSNCTTTKFSLAGKFLQLQYLPMRWEKCCTLAVLLWSFAALAQQERLPNTQPLALEVDLSAQMVEGIDRFLMREIESSVASRLQFWQRDFSSPDAYKKSIQPNRERFAKMVGAVEERIAVKALDFVSTTETPAKIAETKTYEVFAVRWPVFENVFAEGLWLKPKNEIVARIVAIPDAGQTPEMLAGLVPGIKPDSQFARRLAENGCEVLVPTLISRDDNFSGNAKLNRFTNQPHREWIYRQAYELGRHIIGYEVQKISAAVDFFEGENTGSKTALKIGVAGYGEGGLLALYAAAIDPRIEVTLVSGYFDSRQKIWSEPIYRNLFGLLREFGDAEIATLIAPRGLVVEHSVAPKIDGPPVAGNGRNGAAPGKITTSDYQSVGNEFERAKAFLQPGGEKFSENFQLISGTEGRTTGPGSDRALTELLRQLGVQVAQISSSEKPAQSRRDNFNLVERQGKQVHELAGHVQQVFRDSERVRENFFWQKMKEAKSPEQWGESKKDFQNKLWDEVIGRLPGAAMPTNPRSRKIFENEKSTGYEVVLDTRPDIFAWGILLLPKDLKEGERRPVVVCQHGLEGVPMDVVTTDAQNPGYKYYKGFATQLAERGFIVFAPHNPYRGGDKFRVLQRKANSIAQSLFSVILAQHQQILNWLSEQPFVDAKRIGFYGLSYGGKTAMRVPSLLDGYALSICSGDFNEWILKNVSVEFPGSYMFTGEYEMPERNLGSTFNYAEMAALIAPRPFMVERGHSDGVGIDEQVAYEYAKVRRLYDRLGIGERTEIEFFNGPHEIHGVGTYEFLHQHLNWPER